MYATGFHCLLRGVDGSNTLSTERFWTIKEVISRPLLPSSEEHCITAKVDGATLSQAHYSNVCSLICSMFCLPTGALVYNELIYDPLTLHWHCTTLSQEIFPHFSIGLLSEMAQARIQIVTMGKKFVIPQKNVSTSFLIQSI